MLQQAHGLLLDKLVDHVAEHCTHGVKPLVRLADVRQAHVIQQYLLYDEYRDCLAKFRTSLHNAKAQRDDLGREEEVDNIRGVVFDQRSDDAERC